MHCAAIEPSVLLIRVYETKNIVLCYTKTTFIINVSVYIVICDIEIYTYERIRSSLSQCFKSC